MIPSLEQHGCAHGHNESSHKKHARSSHATTERLQLRVQHFRTDRGEVATSDEVEVVEKKLLGSGSIDTRNGELEACIERVNENEHCEFTCWWYTIPLTSLS